MSEGAGGGEVGGAVVESAAAAPAEAKESQGKVAAGQEQDVKPIIIRRPKAGIKDAAPLEPKDAPKEAKGEPRGEAEGESEGKGSTTYKIKVLGQERELTEEQYQRYAQKGVAADEKLRQASEKMREADQLLQLAQRDPLAYLQRTGVDVHKLAEEMLYHKYREEELSPEQRQQKSREEKLRQYEEAERHYETQRQQEEREHRANEARQRFLTDTKAALESAGLPFNNQAVLFVASYMEQAERTARAQGNEAPRVAPADVIPWMRQDIEAMLGYQAENMPDDRFQQVITSRFEKADGKTLAKILGEDSLRKIREYELSRLGRKAQAPQSAQIVGKPAGEERPAYFSNWQQISRSF